MVSFDEQLMTYNVKEGLRSFATPSNLKSKVMGEEWYAVSDTSSDSEPPMRREEVWRKEGE